MLQTRQWLLLEQSTEGYLALDEAASLELVECPQAEPQQRRGKRQDDQRHQRCKRNAEGDGAPRSVHFIAQVGGRKTPLLLLRRPLAAEILLCDVERPGRRRKIGDNVQIQPAHLVG